jgi:predicted nucleic acid-binding Zn ribbon protein
MRTRRAPVPLAGASEALTRRLEPDTPLAQIQRVWADAAGPVMAAECDPVGFRAGVLTVDCRSSVWANELVFLAPDLVRNLNERLGTAKVTDVRSRTR